MRMGQLIILCLLVIALVSIILWNIEAQGKISNMIQAGAIIALVFVTLFYAGQTKKLVDQERISLNEERKKRLADFGENNLEKFYMPVQYRLNNIKNMIEDSNDFGELLNFTGWIDKDYIAMVNVLEKYGYLAPENFEKSIIKFKQLLRRTVGLGSDKIFSDSKSKMLSILEEIFEMIKNKVKRNLKMLDEYYKKRVPDKNMSKEIKTKGEKMNNPQKVVIGITLIIIGFVLIMFIALTTDITNLAFYVPEFTVESLFVVILGIVLIAGGLIVLFSLKKEVSHEKTKKRKKS